MLRIRLKHFHPLPTTESGIIKCIEHNFQSFTYSSAKPQVKIINEMIICAIVLLKYASNGFELSKKVSKGKLYKISLSFMISDNDKSRFKICESETKNSLNKHY